MSRSRLPSARASRALCGLLTLLSAWAAACSEQDSGTGGLGVVGSALVGDTSVAPAAAYSVALKLRAGYSGQAFRVRRANDNGESNVGFTSANKVNVAALGSFCGANDCFVSVLYDQSGNARDLLQGLTGSQIKIYDGASRSPAGSGTLPVLSFQSANKRVWRGAALPWTGNPAFTIAYQGRYLGPTEKRAEALPIRILGASTAPGNQVSLGFAGPAASIEGSYGAGSVLGWTAANVNQTHRGVLTHAAGAAMSASGYRFNGSALAASTTTQASGPFTFTAPVAIAIGTDDTHVSGTAAELATVLIWSSVLNTSDRNAVENALNPAVPAPGGAGALGTILGSSLLEYWDARSGTSTTDGRLISWTGQVRGTAVHATSAAGRPALTADGTRFKGLPVVQCSGGQWLEASLGAPLIPAGGYPYFALVGRLRAPKTDSNQALVFGFNHNYEGPSADGGMGLKMNPSQRWSPYMRYGGVTPEFSGPATDTELHFFEYEQRADTGMRLYIDGTLAASWEGGLGFPLWYGTRPALVGFDRVNFCSPGDWSSTAQLSLAQVVVASSLPSPAQRLQLMAQARSAFGLTYCGDGVVTAPEQCDDGNRVHNDACDNTCKTSSTVGDQIETILGSNLVDWWDARLGTARNTSNEVKSWIGQKKGLILYPLEMRPRYGVDGSHFKGQPVVLAAAVDPNGDYVFRYLYGSYDEDLIASGTRPYLAVVHRRRTPLPDQWFGEIIDLTSGTPSPSGARLQLYEETQGTVTSSKAAYARITGPTVATAIAPAESSRPVLSEVWVASDGLHQATNGVERAVTPMSSSALQEALRKISVGIDTRSFAESTDTSFAQVIISKAVPSAAQRAQLLAYEVAQWGVTTDSCAGVSSCAGGDGCCPAGCESSDGDCPPSACTGACDGVDLTSCRASCRSAVECTRWAQTCADGGPFCAPACQCELRCPVPEQTQCNSCTFFRCGSQSFAQGGCALQQPFCDCSAEGAVSAGGGTCRCPAWICNGQRFPGAGACQSTSAQDCAMCGSQLVCPQPRQEQCLPSGCVTAPDPNCVPATACTDDLQRCATCLDCAAECGSAPSAECGLSCPDGSPLGSHGCPDQLDPLGHQLITLQRQASIPASGGPGAAQLHALTRTAHDEVQRVIDALPTDIALGTHDDLTPYLASLGRAWSTLAMLHTGPIGSLPNGALCSDRLEGTRLLPNEPLISQLFAQLPAQNDPQAMTRAVHLLGDFQHLIQCLNRSELVRLDLGLSQSLMSVLARLASQKKTVLGLALLDHALPIALLTFDAAKGLYTPRMYRILRLPNDFWTSPRLAEMFPFNDLLNAKYAEIPSTLSLDRVAFEQTAVRQLYCERPAAQYTLSRVGIWLADLTHGARLNRVRLGSVTPCQFLDRATDLVRLGDGSCSLTEIAYSGYQCKSDRTCNLADPSRYQLGARIGSSKSPLNQFGIAKTAARQASCEPLEALGGGPLGFGQDRPTTECVVTAAGLAEEPQSFGECLRAASGQLLGPIDPGSDPWTGSCGAIQCAEGDSCEPPPSGEDEADLDPPGDLNGDGNGDDDGDGKVDEDESKTSCSAECRAEKYANQKSASIGVSVSDLDAQNPGYVQPGGAEAAQQVAQNLPPITVQYGVDLSSLGLYAGVLERSDPSDPATIVVDSGRIAREAGELARSIYGQPDRASCYADPACGAAAATAFHFLLEEVLEHEYLHVVIDALLGSQRVFTAAGEGYFREFSQVWQNGFKEDPLLKCNHGAEIGFACSAEHRLLEDIQRPRPGVPNCPIDGACGDCGRRKTVGEECRELTDLLRAAYTERLRAICPAPRPNEVIPPECQLPGCFGDSIPTTAEICRFTQCGGDRALSLDLACSCCTQCQPGAPPAMTGTSPSCRTAPDCRECCIHCLVPDGQVCPPPVDITAAEEPPAWAQGPQ